MKFTLVTPDENYQGIKMQSRKWEMGLNYLMYGVRLCAGTIGDTGYTLEYCCGAEEDSLNYLYAKLLLIFSFLPEDITAKELKSFMPVYSRTKPIYKDANWQHLDIILNKLKNNDSWDKIPCFSVCLEEESTQEYLFYLWANDQKIGKINALSLTDFWLIKDICINLDYRNQGLGTYLLQASCQIMWDKDFKNCRIEECPNDFRVKWYESMGFLCEGEYYERKAGDWNYKKARDLNWA